MERDFQEGRIIGITLFSVSEIYGKLFKKGFIVCYISSVFVFLHFGQNYSLILVTTMLKRKNIFKVILQEIAITHKSMQA